MQVWFSWLIKFPFAFHPWEQAENPANKNLIIHSKIIQLLNKNLKTNISASEWMTLVSAVILLLDSECDSALPGPLQFLCFLGAVKKMAKCALSGENVHQWLQGWDQRGSHTGKAQLEQMLWTVCAWFGSVAAQPEAFCFLLVGIPRASTGVWPGCWYALKCFCVAAMATHTAKRNSF